MQERELCLQIQWCAWPDAGACRWWRSWGVWQVSVKWANIENLRQCEIFQHPEISSLLSLLLTPPQYQLLPELKWIVEKMGLNNNLLVLFTYSRHWRTTVSMNRPSCCVAWRTTYLWCIETIALQARSLHHSSANILLDFKAADRTLDGKLDP